MPPSKRQKRDTEDDDEVLNEEVNTSEGENEEGSNVEFESEPESDGNASADTDDEIAEAQQGGKSKKTLKRKHRATHAAKFGSALQSLLSTETPSALPLSLKPSIARKRNDEKLETKGKKIIQVERKEREEKGRVKDLIGGWGGEGERALRKVAQRGVVKLFNVIQQSQTTAAAAEEDLKAQRGTGKPTLPAPSLAKEKKKGKIKPNALGQDKNVVVGEDDFLNSIRSGGIVSKA
ncbi:hypothetical protein BDW22DRAFT_1350554 [Trametopsis cervina]|nr:hypothetical protein BDW22DRAFT_1350554 [Trametopsis cervina]